MPFQRRRYLRQRSYTEIELGGVLHRSLAVQKGAVASRRRRPGLRNPLADAIAELQRAAAATKSTSSASTKAAAASAPETNTSDNAVLAEQERDNFRRRQVG